MAKNHGRLHDVPTDTSVRVVVDVGPAYTHGVRSDAQLSGPTGEASRNLADVDLVLLLKDNGFHDSSPQWM